MMFLREKKELNRQYTTSPLSEDKTRNRVTADTFVLPREHVRMEEIAGRCNKLKGFASTVVLANSK